MTARTHDIIAFASLITVSVYYPPQSLNVITLGAVLVGNIVGALLPDIDQATNRLWDLLPVGNFTGSVMRKLFLSHRTISHSILGLFIIYKILAIFLPLIFNPVYVDHQLVLASIMIGYISHLGGDLITKDGLPLLFPITYKFAFPPIRSLRVKTDSFVEKFIIFPATLMYIFWFVGSHQPQVAQILRLIK